MIIPAGVSRRGVLRAGYGATALLLILTAVQAVWIQEAFSERSLSALHRYANQEQQFSEIRLTVLRAASEARDYFLSPQADRGRIFQAQLDRRRDEARLALDELDRLNARGQPHQHLRGRVEDFWQILAPVANGAVTPKDAYDFVQREIAPRRLAVGDLARELTETAHEALNESEREFSGGRQAAFRRLLITLAVSLIAAAGVGYLSIAHSDRLERATISQMEEIEESRKKQGQLSSRLREIQEQERKSLSRELHDEIGQTLTVMLIEVSQALALAGQNGAAAIARRLEAARGLGEKAVSSIRDISRLLRPAVLDDLGLGAALEWLTNDFSRRTGTKCDFIEDGLDPRIPDSVKTCVYRVVQEALHNCEKHAGASHVSVNLSHKDGVSVHVQDDGRGFAVDGQSLALANAGLGLLGMKERARELNGALAVQSAPGAGTAIKLWLPVQPDTDVAGLRRTEARV